MTQTNYIRLIMERKGMGCHDTDTIGTKTQISPRQLKSANTVEEKHLSF